MKIYLLTYGTSDFSISLFWLKLTAKLFGVDHCIVKHPTDLHKTNFYTEFKSILDQKRGGGYWLWKPYYIDYFLTKINDGDVLIYSDAGTIFRNRIKPLVDQVCKTESRGVMFFYQNQKNSQWTKRDCFVSLGCDNEAFYNSPQILANFQVYQKNEFSLGFIREALAACTQDNLITDSPNSKGKDNLNNYIEHRHDQSIFSLLAHKNNLPIYTDPSQGRGKNILYSLKDGENILEHPPYKKIIYLHRMRNRDYKNVPLYFLSFLKRKFLKN